MGSTGGLDREVRLNADPADRAALPTRHQLPAPTNGLSAIPCLLHKAVGLDLKPHAL